MGLGTHVWLQLGKALAEHQEVVLREQVLEREQVSAFAPY